MLLEQQVALVTGAGQGIGRAIALAFAREGADVVIADIAREPAEQAKAMVEAQGRRAEFLLGDVSNSAQAEALVKDAARKMGRLDILVNNAGITRDGLLVRMSDEDWDRVIAINLKGAFNCSKAAARIMTKQRHGRIINMASVIGLRGNAGQSNYAASKAGLIGLTKSLARELASRGITCNAIAPGYIKTAMTDVLPEAVKQRVMEQIPMGRFGEPDDVASVAVFLASAMAQYITGQVIVVDGGLAM